MRRIGGGKRRVQRQERNRKGGRGGYRQMRRIGGKRRIQRNSTNRRRKEEDTERGEERGGYRQMRRIGGKRRVQREERNEEDTWSCCCSSFNCSACGYGTLTCSPDVLPVPDLLFSTL
jgi:hypothetical protein